MFHKLTERVWFGNWEAPFECIGQVGCIINVAHHFSGRRGRNVYWQRLESIPWDVLYYRLAKKDQHEIDEPYIFSLSSAVSSAVMAGRLPILTHCQMGGHRGPTSAIFVAWQLAGRKAAELDQLHAKVLELEPGLATTRIRRGRNYYESMMRYCRGHSV